MNDAILKLLQDRYFVDGESSWEDISKRVSTIYPPIESYIKDMWFIPSTPTLMNGGTDKRSGTLSSCFPMNIEDSIEGIFDALKECAIVTKSGGGIGLNFSTLRSSQEIIKTLDAKSSGPLAFIENFNSMLDSIRQGGKRRGAGAGLLSIEHPDILEFIKLKDTLSKINRLNLSIMIPSSFYEKLEKDPESIHKVKFKDNSYKDLEDIKGNKVSVKQLWDLIISQAWKCAEPGIFNETIAFDRCTVTHLNTNVIMNPCSEYTNIPYTSCALGSINLVKMLDGKRFNWERFEETIVHATRFINNTLDVNNYPLRKILETTLKVRAIGIGIMGLAHALYLKDIPYNSEKAKQFTEDVIRYLTLRSMQESVKLAKEYREYQLSKDSKWQFISNKASIGGYEAINIDLYMKANERFFTKNCRDINIEELKKEIKEYGVRNSATTSIAPTGSISFIANVSGGIEPVFALSYARKIEKLNREYEVVYITDPIFEKYLDETFDKQTKEKILKEITENQGSCQKCKDIPEEIRKIFVTAGDLTPIEHLDILEAACNQTALSVSKTVNLPSTATKEEVAEVFIEAHKRGIIGVTIYRDGCREGILVHNTSLNGNGDKIVERHAPKRPKKLPCDVYKVMYQGKAWVVFVGLLENKPYEIFAGSSEDVTIPKNITEGFIIKQKSRHYSFEYDGEIIVSNICKTFANKENDAFARTISMGLRHGAPIQYVVETLNKSEGDITHLAKVLARTLKKYIEDGQEAGKCPSCGNKLAYKEGCICCPSCGFSVCN